MSFKQVIHYAYDDKGSNKFLFRKQQKVLIDQRKKGKSYLFVKQLSATLFGRASLYVEAVLDEQTNAFVSAKEYHNRMKQDKNDELLSSSTSKRMKMDEIDNEPGAITTTVVAPATAAQSECNHVDEADGFIVVKEANIELIRKGRTTSGHRVSENPFKEIQIMSKLSEGLQGNAINANFTQMQFSFFDDMNVFIGMKYIRGNDLFAFISSSSVKAIKNRSRSLSLSDEKNTKEGDEIPGVSEAVALPLFRDVVQAVKYIHSRGIVHLDISPENIMIERIGNGLYRAVLIDFGLARMLDDEKIADEEKDNNDECCLMDFESECSSSTNHDNSQPENPSDDDIMYLSQPVGKLIYMAPEMYAIKAESRNGSYNPRRMLRARPCDVWCLGSTLFAMLYGRKICQDYPSPQDPLFQKLLMGNCTSFKRSIRSWGYDISNEVCNIFQNTLQIDPLKRSKIEEVENMIV